MKRKQNACQLTSKATFNIRTNSNNVLKRVNDYKYLGSHILNSEKDFNIRKWSSCNKVEKIWKSNLERDFKIRIFRATIEPVLLYGSETWTLSAKQQRRLDGCYTCLLRRVKNLSWKNHPTLETIYGNLPRISSVTFLWLCLIKRTGKVWWIQSRPRPQDDEMMITSDWAYYGLS